MIHRQTSIWTTRDGRRVRICDMSDSHLLNTIKWLMRTSEDRLDAALSHALGVESFVTAEAGSCCASAIVSQLEDTTPLEFLCEDVPIFENLVAEARRRGLTLPPEIDVVDTGDKETSHKDEYDYCPHKEQDIP